MSEANVGEVRNPIALLEQVDVLPNQPLPDIEDLHALATASNKSDREFGVQLYQRGNTKAITEEAATYCTGTRTSIYEPDKPEDAVRGVFFHTHPKTPSMPKRKFGLPTAFSKSTVSSWYMMPSDSGIRDITEMAGDVAAHFSQRLGDTLTSPAFTVSV